MHEIGVCRPRRESVHFTTGLCGASSREPLAHSQNCSMGRELQCYTYAEKCRSTPTVEHWTRFLLEAPNLSYGDVVVALADHLARRAQRQSLRKNVRASDVDYNIVRWISQIRNFLQHGRAGVTYVRGLQCAVVFLFPVIVPQSFPPNHQSAL